MKSKDEFLYDQNEEAATNAIINGWRDVAEIGELTRLADCRQGELTLALLHNSLLLWLTLQVQESKYTTKSH